ncbi:MAG: sulfatase-like hydrolase/transferase [Lentisphaerae bacterium]|jgi:arylsulfatase A-like enzyme|nr:sulfatase-like hydrolase/transferase [Lentisphaerota bacterium]MBT4820407.1 sulfatase-like hydrolase/transferase [Lentisphaerota bacterium]MBT5606529.1 sulfatase-like hydrolase/transferase [Lentisphaerota bacterium]MBT7055025.1 sulfatase-like hydrolase/transferase [Lentisphaerota bacterium]MBT7845341.1 sulfatase-like hydrolase/transferase [Lentisphaerota bacterium]
MQFLDEKRGMHPFDTRDVERPNVFVFTVDMIPPEFHRQPSECLTHMRRPAWQTLESDSVSFTNAFAVSPLCGPSRASMFTGRYPYILVNEERAHDGCEVELRPDDPIYPDYLKAAGYLMGHVGKSHIGTATFARVFGESCSPWNRWAPPIYDDPEYHEYLRAMGVDGFRFKRRIEGLRTDRTTAGNFYGGWLEQKNGMPFPLEATYPHYLVHRALALLDSLLERNEDNAPLYLHLDLFAPHQPFLIPAGLEEREQALRADVPLPAGYTGWRDRDYKPAGPEPGIYATYRSSWGLYDENTARDYQIAHLLQMEVIDSALRVFVERLKALGLYDSGIVLLTADHGEMNLEQGLIDKGVYGHPKPGRIPMLLKLPNADRAGEIVEQDVSLLDIAPTFLEVGGIDAIGRHDGESLFRRLVPGDQGHDEPFVFEAGWHVAPNPAVAINKRFEQGHFRYVYNACSDVDELYDLDDPGFTNQIDDPACAEIRVTMRRELQEIVNNDARWRCYRQAFELTRYEDLEQRAGDGQMFIPE